MASRCKRKRQESECVFVTIETLLCPVTQSLMIHPAVASDGHTYERAAIRKWLLGTKMTSPLTNEGLENRSLRPNHTLRGICNAALAALPEKARSEALEAALQASALESAQLEKLCANVTLAEPYRTCPKRWAFSMDGDSVEDVARLIVSSLRCAMRKGERSAIFARGLSALRMVCEVSKDGACAAGAPECALEIIEAVTGTGVCLLAIEAALSVIATVGGGSRPDDALVSVQLHTARPSGLAALAALIPTCDPSQLEFCQNNLVEALGSQMAHIVSAAMKPAAALAVRHSVPSIRDAMAAAMLTFHFDEGVQLSALRSISEQVLAVRKADRTLELIGFGLTAQLMRVNSSGSKNARDCATALCATLGVLLAAPPQRTATGERSDDDSDDARSDEDSDESSDAGDWDGTTE